MRRLLPFVLGLSFCAAAPGVATPDLSVGVAAEGAMTVGDAQDCHAVADPILTLSRPLAGPLLST